MEENTATLTGQTEDGGDIQTDATQSLTAPSEAQPSTWYQATDEEGNFSENWRELLPDHLKEEKSLADFKRPDSILESYINTKAMVGKAADGIVLPKDMEQATDEDKANLRRLTGAPEDPKEYGITRPEGIDEAHWNDDQASAVAELLHKHGAPKGLAADLMAFDAARQQAAAEGNIEAQKAYVAEQTDKLKGEWGANYEERVSDAVKVAKLAAGGTLPDDHPIHTNPQVLRDYAGLAQHFKEDTLRAVDAAARGGKTNAEKAEDAMTNPDNPLYAHYMRASDNVTEEQQAKANSQIQEWLANPNGY